MHRGLLSRPFLEHSHLRLLMALQARIRGVNSGAVAVVFTEDFAPTKSCFRRTQTSPITPQHTYSLSIKHVFITYTKAHNVTLFSYTQSHLLHLLLGTQTKLTVPNKDIKFILRRACNRSKKKSL